MHSSMDKPASEMRPFCHQCKLYFRKWGRSTKKHERDNPGHRLYTKSYTNR